MKPTQSVLMQGPVVVLGLEGPSHAFIKFKSFVVSELLVFM
jgi:hypothetical protein